jgi:ribonuclease-3
MTPERAAALDALAERIGHRFREPGLLDQALTHASRANEDLARGTRDNEPLEFLGDAILGFLVSELLHRRDPDGDEGAMSRARGQLVCETSLSARSEALGLPKLLALGRGEEKTGGRHKRSLWADAYEAIVAALYLDGGIEAERRFVEEQFGAELLDRAGSDQRDHKSALQELLQGRGRPRPEYEVVEELGPSHRRQYRVRCVVDGAPVSEGEGYSKKEAQQIAAREALARLSHRVQPAPRRG